MPHIKRRLGQKATNNSAAEQDYKQEKHTRASELTGLNIESIHDQPKDTEKAIAKPEGTYAASSTVFRSRRMRKAPAAAKRKIELQRFGLKQAATASPQSLEAWCIIKTSYNGRYQVEQPYLVDPELQDILDEHLRPIKLQLILNQDGSYGLLYTKLTDGYENSWMDSAELCSEQLEQGWGRVISERAQKQYVYAPVTNGKALPTADEFPNLEEVIKEVFADHTIRDLSDPVLEDMGIYIDPNQAA